MIFQNNNQIINSVNEFISEIKNSSEEKIFFYRGHSDKNYQLEPGIYRNNNYLINEHKMFNEIISRIPDSFNHMDTLEKLALMQHYGLPTRILDLTQNALVALYFACEQSNNSDGEVIVFGVDDEDISYYNSDKVAILSNISKCNLDFKYEYNFLKYLYNLEADINNKLKIYPDGAINNSKFNDAFTELNRINFHVNSIEINNYINTGDYTEILNNNYNYLSNGLGHKEIPKNISEVISHYTFDRLRIGVLEVIEKEKMKLSNAYFHKLLSNIREDKPHFLPKIDPRDLNRVLLVQPKLSNARIIRQHGAFLLFGCGSEKKAMPKIQQNWIFKRIRINNSKKNEILDDLKTLGIYRATIFPEMDHVSQYLKNKF